MAIDDLQEAKRAAKLLKKKLADIAVLVQKSEAGCRLSSEEVCKVERKAGLQASVSYLDMLLVRLQAREDRKSAESAAVVLVATETVPTMAPAAATRVTPKPKQVAAELSATPAAAPVAAPTMPPSSGGGSAQKKSGKKFISMDEFMTMQQPNTSTAAKSSAGGSSGKCWGAPAALAPSSPAPVASAPAAVSTNCGPMTTPKIAAQANPVTTPARTTTALMTKSNAGAASPVVSTKSEPVPPANATGSLGTPSKPANTIATSATPLTPSTGETRRPAAFSLGDFLPGANPAPVPTPPAKTWGKATPASPAQTSSGSGSGANGCNFSSILAEEEQRRRDSHIPSTLKGNSIPWLIERRPRAESLDIVVQLQQIEAMELREEQERLRLRLRDAKAAEAAGKKEGANSGGKSAPKSGAQSKSSDKKPNGQQKKSSRA